MVIAHAPVPGLPGWPAPQLDAPALQRADPEQALRRPGIRAHAGPGLPLVAGLAARPGRDNVPAGDSREAASGLGQDLLGAVAGDLAARRDRPQQRDLGTAPADR